MKKLVLEESRLVSLSDQELLDLVSFLWEQTKRVQEAMKADPEIERLEAALKSYKEDRYLQERRCLLQKLKAGRALCKVRGLAFKLPEGVSAV